MLSCSNGGILIARHNKIHDKIIHLARQDFYPNYIRIKPLIHHGCSRYEGGAHHVSSITETRVGMLIRGIWVIQKDSIIDVIFSDVDTETYVKERMYTLFTRLKNE